MCGLLFGSRRGLAPWGRFCAGRPSFFCMWRVVRICVKKDLTITRGSLLFLLGNRTHQCNMGASLQGMVWWLQLPKHSTRTPSHAKHAQRITNVYPNVNSSNRATSAHPTHTHATDDGACPVWEKNMLPAVYPTRSTSTKHALQNSLEGLNTPKCNHIRRQQIVDCHKPKRRPT